MWEWLITIPIGWQLTLAILVLLSVVIVSIWGRAAIKWGSTTLGFGRPTSRAKDERKRKRSCGDCVLILIGMRDKCQVDVDHIERSVLKEQMNYAEQRIIELQNKLLIAYQEDMAHFRSSLITAAEENKQSKAYSGWLHSTMCMLKDEIRRSFKENNFENLSSGDFTEYCKNKFQTLLAMGQSHMANHYPYEGMMVPAEYKNERLLKTSNDLYDMCYSVFENAREIKRDAKKNVIKIHEEFKKDINTFVGE